VRNSNGRTLLAQLEQMGIRGEALGVAPDTPAELERFLRRGLDGDVLLITGGVSVGDYDLVGDALSELGLRLLFHKVAMKPGKPILAGRAGDCLVLGLPGNPVSAFTGFALFVAPVLRRMMGYRDRDHEETEALLEEPILARSRRETYHLARLSTDGETTTARPVRSTGSGDVLALCRANGFVVTPAGATETPAGTRLRAIPWPDSYRV
jgi:molybdopterin molybdotransferase